MSRFSQRKNGRSWPAFSLGLSLAASLCLTTPGLSAVAQETLTVSESLPPLVSFVTHHNSRIRGRNIAYTATAGETLLRNGRGEPTASLFSFTYVKDDAPLDRPVIFVFNGGPGSSSIWLHMGVVGPRRVQLDQEVNPSNVPPFGVVDNPDSLLDVADLVFIDPVGTGFSRIIGVGKPEDFYGVDQDAESIAQFIELWLSANGRWNAPKYLMGESYGSARAALLPRALMGGPTTYSGVMRGITVNGIILLGSSLNAQGASPDPVRAAALNLPAMAATAWSHDRVGQKTQSLADFDHEVSAFAMGDYVNAAEKAAAGTLDSNERTAILARLHHYTGVPAEVWPENLILSTRAFSHALLSDQGLAIGLYDGRYTLPIAGDGGEPVADDPAMSRYVPGFVSAFHQMLSRDLNVKMQQPYGAIVWRDLLFNWNWTRAGVPAGHSFAADLATAMRRNQNLRVLVASGYFDLVTTPAAAKDSLQQAGVPADRTVIRDYESGHMLYLGDTAAAFSDDVRSLIAATH